VPYAFFKVIVDVTDEKQLRALSFVMPQAVTGSDLVEAYLVSIDQIESATGLDLMSMLEDRLEDDLESRAAYRFW
jgi:DNA/RNA endonuclease G, NUC1